MTATTTAPAPATIPSRRSLIPRGLGALTHAELRLFSRDVGSVFFALIFPSILMVGMGYAIPGLREPVEGLDPMWEGLLVIHIFAPAIVCTAIATVALTTLPNYLASYREQGIFRRLCTTPMRPGGVLYAHLMISVLCLTVATGLALAAGAIVLDLPMPQRPVLTAVVFGLGAAAMLGVGLIIGGLAPKASSASGIGMLVYFPMLFFAGLWTPGPMMPDALAVISSYTPMGAASQAMSIAWYGEGFPLLQIAVLGGYGVATFALAARTFRWS